MSAANVTPISPHIAGFVAEIAVKDNQLVKAGQLLVRLDDRDCARSGGDHADASRCEQRTASNREAARRANMKCSKSTIRAVQARSRRQGRAAS